MGDLAYAGRGRCRPANRSQLPDENISLPSSRRIVSDGWCASGGYYVLRDEHRLDLRVRLQAIDVVLDAQA